LALAKSGLDPSLNKANEDGPRGGSNSLNVKGFFFYLFIFFIFFFEQGERRRPERREQQPERKMIFLILF